MSTAVDTILANLKIVADERAHRRLEAGLAPRVAALKEFQQRRFSHTYADLLLTARYTAAARFFVDELYGPNNFSHRDAQFARVVPALVRLFPTEVVQTVETLAQLHALSETLDTAMAAHIRQVPITGHDYIRAWQKTGRALDRDLQIGLTLEVAARLDRVTRTPLLHNSLRLMRGPARATGLAELQRFLEAGFATFRAMRGAGEFMEIIEARERALAFSLFSANASDVGTDGATARALTNLPAGCL